MCLDTRVKPEVEKKMVAKLPNKPVTVYRWVRNKKPKGYRALFTEYFFKKGLNVAKKSKVGGQMDLEGLYKPGFHSYKTAAGARWRRSGCFHGTVILIKAQICKEWITAIGRNGCSVVYVTNKIISPSSRDKSAVVE